MFTWLIAISNMNSHVDEPTLIYPVHNFPSDKITGIAKTLLKKNIDWILFQGKKRVLFKNHPKDVLSL